MSYRLWNERTSPGFPSVRAVLTQNLSFPHHLATICNLKPTYGGFTSSQEITHYWNHFCFLFRWQRCKKSVMEEPVSWNAFAWWTASERNNFKACFPDQSSCLRLFFSAVIDALLNKAHYSAYTSALCICHLSYMWFQQFLFHRHECKGSPSLQSWPCVKENHGDL